RLHQPGGPAADRREPVPRDRLERDGTGGHARHQRLRLAGAGLAGRLERQCRVGAREHDRDAARLRNELEGDLDQRADDAVPEQQPVKAGTMTRTSMRTFLCGAVAAIACAGCGGMPERVESWPASVPVETAAATPTDGAIYRDSGDVRLFEDVRAARVG